MDYKWALAQNNFTWLDRLKICGFFLNPRNFWTQSKYVKEYERKIAKYVGCRYAVMVSSGSSANQLIAQFVKDELIKKKEWPRRNQVIVDAVTWQTNVSVWVREGFEPVFIDVNDQDLCLEYDDLDEYLHYNQEKVAAVFPTSLIGFVPDIDRLKALEHKYPKIKFALDNCENSLGRFNLENVSSFFTSTTSLFLAHNISSGAESGLIFTNDPKEYEYFLLARAHGLLRNLNPYKDVYPFTRKGNKLVDPQFDFQVLSSNFRSSDIYAFLSLLDFKRIEEYEIKRFRLYNSFARYLNTDKYYLPPIRPVCSDVAFCLPIILKKENKKLMAKIKNLLNEEKIEFRPLVSGSMLRQVNYQKYGNYQCFANAEWLHKSAIYVGLNHKVKESVVIDLRNKLNEL